MSYVFFEGTLDVDYGDSEDNVYITENSIGLGFNDSKVFKWLKDSALPVCSQTHYGLTEAQLGLCASGQPTDILQWSFWFFTHLNSPQWRSKGLTQYARGRLCMCM